MRPLLLRFGNYTVASYPFFIALAVIMAVIALAFRARRRDLDQTMLVTAIGAAVIAGWLGSRILPVLWSDGLTRFEWAMFLPTRSYGQSMSGFLLTAFPVACICLWGSRRHILAYLDVVCPSILLGLAVAKIACLLAGCCAGRTCATQWSIRYPYGSEPFIRQWRSREFTLPAELIRVDTAGPNHLLGHAQLLKQYSDRPPKALLEQAEAHNLSYPDLLERAASQQSLPVLPVPLWYFIAAGFLWIITETIYRRSSIAGLTAGVTLLSYGLLRLILDQYVTSMDRVAYHLTETQLLAFPIIALGIVTLLFCYYRPRTA